MNPLRKRAHGRVQFDDLKRNSCVYSAHINGVVCLKTLQAYYYEGLNHVVGDSNIVGSPIQPFSLFPFISANFFLPKSEIIN